jgi:hypothetical protein
MQDTQTKEIDELIEKLVHPDNVQRLRFVLDTLSHQFITEVVRGYFGKGNTSRSTILFNKDYSRVRKEDIVHHLKRVVTQEPLFVKWLIRPWLEKAQNDIAVLRDNQMPEGEKSPSLLVTLLWLTGNHGVSQVLLEQLVEKTSTLQEELDLEKQNATNLESEKIRLKTKLTEREDELDSSEQKLKAKGSELTQLAKSHQTAWQLKEDAHTKELNQRTEFFAEKFKNHEARVEQEKTALIAELQRNHELAIQESLTKQQQELTARYESELTTLQAQLDDSVKVRKELEARLETLETARQHSLEELQRQHTEQVQALQTEMDDLKLEKYELEKQLVEREVAQANLKSPSLLPPDDTFGNLLIFHYERGGADALERLLTLFKAYRAFMEGESQNVYLTQVSNIDKFRDTPPEGLLVTDMARLLEDGANSALESFLNLRSLKQETVLRQLVSKLESPKFGEAS